MTRRIVVDAVSILLLALLPIYSEAVDCPTLPDTITVENAFKTLFASQGGEGDPDNVFIQEGPYYTCQVQGTTNGTYQEVAVIMTYTTSTDTTTQIGQCVMDCVGSGNNVGWDGRSNSFEELSSSVDYMNIPLFTNCGRCTKDANNENYCQACHSDCNIGLMRCTGTSSSDCCVAFETNGECIPDLNCDQNNFVANEQNNFICACGLSCGDGYNFNSISCTCDLTDICQADNPCANHAICTLVSSPDQYTCDCTGTNFMGTNCLVCGLTCSSGYTLDSISCTCDLSDICLADNPCANGVCTLVSAPDQYTCDCTGTNYMGTNCLVCGLTCSSGYTLDSISCTCDLSDICLADNPCANGVCTLVSAPDQYTCDCTGTNYMGTNCLVCGLTCSSGYTLNSISCTCDLSDICQADNPCANGVCTLVSSPDQYTCDCTGTNYMGTNCSVCDLQCQNGGTVINSCTCMCTAGYTGTVCNSVIDYCENNNCGLYGSCVNLPDMATHECSCNDGWEGPTCSQCTISNCKECTGNPPVCVTCQENYAVSVSGRSCELSDQCPLSPCKNNGTCRSRPGSYLCLCTEQWSGINCTVCANKYGKDDSIMNCVACRTNNCLNCSNDYLFCNECEDTYVTSSDRTQCVTQERSLIIWIIICSIIGGILVLAIIATAVMGLIRMAGHSNKKQAKKSSRITGPTVNQNPLYNSREDLAEW